MIRSFFLKALPQGRSRRKHQGVLVLPSLIMQRGIIIVSVVVYLGIGIGPQSILLLDLLIVQPIFLIKLKPQPQPQPLCLFDPTSLLLVGQDLCDELCILCNNPNKYFFNIKEFLFLFFGDFWNGILYVYARRTLIYLFFFFTSTLYFKLDYG